MKLLVLLLFLASCASYHHPPFSPVPGVSFDEAVKGLGKAKECVDIEAHRYCLWDKDILVFVDSKFKELITEPNPETLFSVNVETHSVGKNEARKVLILPGSKKLSLNGIQWRKYSPVLEKILKAKGLSSVVNLNESQQVLKVTFGLTQLDAGKFKRYLNLVAYDSAEMKKSKKEVEMWKSSVSSIGSSGDFDKVYPILLGITSELIPEAGNLNKSLIVSDRNLNVQAFKHFVAQ